MKKMIKKNTNISPMKRITIMISLVMFVGLTSAQQANITQEGPVPGDITHPIESFSQQARLTFASAPVVGGDDQVARVRTEIAEDALAESETFIEANDTDRGLALAQRYRNQMDKAVESAEKANMSELSEELENRTQKQVQVLEGLQDKVPEEALTGIQTALGNAEEFSDRFENIEKGKQSGDSGSQGGQPEGTGQP